MIVSGWWLPWGGRTYKEFWELVTNHVSIWVLVTWAFTLWHFIELHTYNLCTFLYPIKSVLKMQANFSFQFCFMWVDVGLCSHSAELSPAVGILRRPMEWWVVRREPPASRPGLNSHLILWQAYGLWKLLSFLLSLHFLNLKNWHNNSSNTSGLWRELNEIVDMKCSVQSKHH